MTLAKYIEKHGASHCAKVWKVSLRTVYYWSEGKTRPQRAVAKRVMKSSGMSYADIYR